MEMAAVLKNGGDIQYKKIEIMVRLLSKRERSNNQLKKALPNDKKPVKDPNAHLHTILTIIQDSDDLIVVEDPEEDPDEEGPYRDLSRGLLDENKDVLKGAQMEDKGQDAEENKENIVKQWA